MLTTVVPRIQVNQIILGVAGKLSTGTITPTGDNVPNRIVAAEILNAAPWNYTDRAGGVLFPVEANDVKHFPGSFVRDMVLDAGTYLVTFYLDA